MLPPSEPSSVQPLAPIWQTVHNKLRHKGVALKLLRQKYRAQQPSCYQCGIFCDHYRRWAPQLATSMRRTHTPGKRLVINYTGQALGATGGGDESHNARVFVAVLGPSNGMILAAAANCGCTTTAQRRLEGLPPTRRASIR